MKSKSWIYVVLVVIALLVVGAVIGMSQKSEASDLTGKNIGKKGNSAPMVVEAVQAKTAKGYEIERTFMGRVEASRESDVGFELSGKLIILHVDEGDTVKKGDRLAELDTALLAAARDEASAALMQIQAEQTLAAKTLKRNQSAYDLGAISDQQLDSAQEALNALNASLIRADASLQRVNVQLEKSVLFAPYDAVVSRRHLDEGRIVGPDSAVFTLLENGKAEARVGVSGDSVGLFEVGSEHVLTIKEKEVPAQVKTVLQTRDATSRSVDVIFSLEADMTSVRRGDLAEITVDRFIEQSGMWLPFHALTESSRGLWAAYLLEGAATHGAVTRRELELLHFDREQVFVRGNIPEQSYIVISGQHKLVPGQQIKIKNL